MATSTPQHQLVVVGAGFSGIGMGIALRKAGMTDFVILDDGDEVGGTWHWNTYPGVAVDIPSFSYQFSFEPRATWSRTYAKGAELADYARHCVDTYGLREHLRHGVTVTGAAYDEEANLWRVTTRDGEELTARYVVNATGVLTQPKKPDIPGVDDFAGATLHTARWDHAQDLTGKRVAIIGTGASAVQIIPEIAGRVESLVVFQRTPIWCLPKPDLPLGGVSRLGLRVLPGAQRVARLAAQAFVEATFPLSAHYYEPLRLAAGVETLARAYVRSQVDDPETAAKLTPSYGLGCKRPSFHNGYLSTYNRPNVHLETTAIEAVTPTGVRTADGTEHEVDVLVLATGFKVFDKGNAPTYPLAGVGGQDLEEWWDEHRFQAYEGVSVPGFPNYFTVFGPYGYNGSSYFQLIEASVTHIMRCLRQAAKVGADRIEVSAEANDRFFAEMLARRGRQVFWRADCAGSNSYYFNQHGDVPLRPSTTPESLWRAGHFDLGDYRFSTVAPREEVAPPAKRVTGPRRVLAKVLP